MGFLKNLFQKKVCDFCGGEIGLLGNRKLEDGNMCKDCASKLSYWFDERRHSTVEQIRQQLAYREANQAKVAKFRSDKIFEGNYDIRVQMEGPIPCLFLVARTDDPVKENADLLTFTGVKSFKVDIREDKDEQTYVNDEGKRVSYRPRRFDYSYDFYVKIETVHPYCDTMSFRLNRSTLKFETTESTGILIKPFDPMTYPEYREYKFLADELEAVFRAGMQVLPYQPLGAVAPVAAPVATAPVATAVAAPVAANTWKCFCGTENTGKFCAECGIMRFKPEDIHCSECSWTIEEPGQVPSICPSCDKKFNNDDLDR
jgi:hypothetical protein